MFHKAFNTLIDRLAHDDTSVALISDTNRMTYAELGKRVAAIHAALVESDGGKQNLGPVLVRGHKQIDVVAAMIASTCAARGFVFAETSFPPARVEKIIQNCGCSVMIDAGEDHIDVSVGTILTQPLADLPFQMPYHTSQTDTAPFYITFTSGSTGEPKGIPIQRDNFFSLWNWMEPHIVESMDGPYAAINHASMSFDMAMTDIWPPLLAGRATYILDHRHNANPHAIVSILRRQEDVPAGTLTITPAFLSILLESNRFNAEKFPQLKGFWVGGEEAPKPLLRRLRKAFPDSTIYHCYGPSEVTCITHCHPVTDADLDSKDPLTLGLILGETKMLVDTGDGELHETGEGEIVLVGTQVAGRYLPEGHPNNVNFGTFKGMPSYRSGDNGIITADGKLLIIGRIDRQVKMNGLRIELGAIEQCALDVPGISTAVAVLRTGVSKSLMLIIDGDGLPDDLITAVRAHLAEQLPPYMQPAVIEACQEFPLTLSGKIDRRKMSKMYA
ncbi:MAG: AMP-binding protein [Sulfitobacter sp.]